MQDTRLFIILCIGGLGLFVFYLGWYRRIIDGGRYCRHCNYRVDPLGDHVARCPECGSGLLARGTVLPYQRQRSIPLVAFGLILILLSSGAAVTEALFNLNSIDIYRYLPSWYLLSADVSPDDEYGNEQVDVLRDRVQEDRLSEAQLQKFTNMLCRRATNLHHSVAGGGLNYTGMTANLLKLYKPDKPLVDDLMHSLFTQQLHYFSLDARIRPDGTVVVQFPSLILNPVQPFLSKLDLTSYRMRGEIVSVEMSQDGNEWIEGKTTFDGRWNAEITDPEIETNLPIALRMRVNWYIEPETLRWDLTGDPPGETSPWHSFEYTLELERGRDSTRVPSIDEFPSISDIQLEPIIPNEQ